MTDHNDAADFEREAISDAKIGAAADAACKAIADAVDTDMDFTMALGGAVLQWSRISGIPLELFFAGVRALDKGNPPGARRPQ